LTWQEIDSLYRDTSFGTKDKELTRFTINDLNKESIRRYRIYLKNIKPEHQYNALSDEEFLTKIRAIENKKVTVAGLLVFGTEDTIGNYFSDFKIDYLEIFGTTYENATKRYEFRLSDYPNIYEYFFAIYERLIKKIDIPFKLRGAFRDENQPQVKAIREAIVNLLIHSDYFSPMKPRIRVFLNRIEFFNPGALPKPYEELRKGDISMPRNPIITRIFRVIDLAENAGYGFDKMFNGWRHYYTRDPVVFEGTDYYRIEFFFDAKGTVKDHEKWYEKWYERGLTEREIEILTKIKKNPKSSIKKLSEVIGINPSSIQNHLEKLKQRGIIERIGPAKGGHWEVIEE
jgi:ATP-dependent DNA helicase RecG